MKAKNVKGLLLSKIFSNREVESLGTLMSRMPNSGLEESISWISDLVNWLRQPLSLTEELKLPWTKFRLKLLRFGFLIEFLDHNKEFKEKLQNLFCRVLLESRSSGFFLLGAHLGDGGVLSSSMDRILRKFLPLYRHDKDIGEILSFLFPHADDAKIFESFDESLRESIIDVFLGGVLRNHAAQAKLQKELKESMLLLSQLALSLRLDPAICKRLEFSEFSKEPSSKILKILLTAEQLTAEEYTELESLLKQSQTRFTQIYKALEFEGVSMNLVLLIERLQSKQGRLLRLLELSQIKTENQKHAAWYEFFVELIVHAEKQKSLRALLNQNLRLLAKKIVDRSSHTGEHYIVKNRAEYRAMLMAALGGGLLTFITVLVKYYTSGFKLPLFSEGFFSWVNYTGSFMLMHFLHLTLATKQPSMTASALAEKMTKLEKEKEFEDFVEQFARISRAQFIAAVGNIGAIIPAAYLFNLAYVNLTKIPLMSPSYAEYTIHSLHPFQGPTLLYAAFTGVILWISSLVSGWIENFFIYRETPKALRQNLLIQRSLGRGVAERLASFVEKQVGPLAGNVALGGMLAFTGIFGKFFGLPLEVRHVTLSAGTLTLAVLSLGNLMPKDLAVLYLGIALIGVLNFSVSFYCSFMLATRARGVSGALQRRLLLKAFMTLFRRPLYFFFPEKA